MFDKKTPLVSLIGSEIIKHLPHQFAKRKFAIKCYHQRVKYSLIFCRIFELSYVTAHTLRSRAIAHYLSFFSFFPFTNIIRVSNTPNTGRRKKNTREWKIQHADLVRCLRKGKTPTKNKFETVQFLYSFDGAVGVTFFFFFST